MIYKVSRIQKDFISKVEESYTFSQPYLYDIGTVESDPPLSEILEDIWHACNVSCWNSEWKGEDVALEHLTYHPNNENCGLANSDLLIYDENTSDEFWVAQTCGWHAYCSYEEAVNALKNKFIIYCY